MHEIVARQWEVTTRTLLDDLAEVEADRIHSIRYDQFVADPQAEARRLCRELDIAWDVQLQANLPHSRHTLTAPTPDKWRRHALEINAVLPLIEATRVRAEAVFRGR